MTDIEELELYNKYKESVPRLKDIYEGLWQNIVKIKTTNKIKTKNE